MTARFTWEAWPSRVVLAPGGLAQVAAEVDRIGAKKAVLIGGGTSTRVALSRLRAALGERVVTEVAESAQHVPEELAGEVVALTEQAAADIVVTVGGGSATGLGKVVAMKCHVPLIAVPTTYAGSEMTPVWGRTSAARKETGHDPEVLPRAVVYDPELCVGMPARLAAASGMNALAHCIEAFWASGSNPVTDVIAGEGIRRLLAGLPRVVADQNDVDAHTDNLIGACMAGMSFAQAGSGIHHRTCHVLGGGWNLPHAETHAVVLPHSTALVAAWAPRAVERVTALLGGDDAPTALFAMVRMLGLPLSLAEIAMPANALDEAASRIAKATAGDPIAPDVTECLRMLEGAYAGHAPEVVRSSSDLLDGLHTRSDRRGH